jgi:hypothetical protein
VMILLSAVGYQGRLVIERQQLDHLPHVTVERLRPMQRSH